MTAAGDALVAADPIKAHLAELLEVSTQSEVARCSGVNPRTVSTLPARRWCSATVATAILALDPSELEPGTCGSYARERANADPTWMDQGACRGCDPNLFHPERGESCRQAKAVCATCPVIDDCLNYALTTGEKLGIWGGRSERERRQLRRTRHERTLQVAS